MNFKEEKTMALLLDRYTKVGDANAQKRTNLPSGKIKYSYQASGEGYSFSCLSDKEQQMTKHLYTSEDDMSNFYCAYRTVRTIAENPKHEKPLHKEWGFPVSGRYSCFILDCYPKREDDNTEFIMEILLDGCMVKYIKFTKSKFNSEYAIIYSAMKRRFLCKDNIFFEINLDKLKYLPAMIDIENIESKSGKIYSKPVGFYLLTEEEYELKTKMAKIMLNFHNIKTDD